MEPTNLDAKVRERAYELWEEAGSPWGQEHEFWAAASREIEGEKIDPVTLDRSVAR
ncbi:DUF2934 domain-containing protein [Aureimonas sp. Leaf324]|uniref:DUF2934 domain-containing protein n=1 Tax=Aureimonas sp. Leaf324 TaxID=1736336 RepID=UPI0009E920B3|nr:DUF2934 domain-containing protein [Aureimonas sp. Leaf324]